MKIGFFPCNNGLGHIKRSLYIANLINKKIPIDFYSKIKNKKKFNINKNIKFKLINSPKNLNDFSKKNYPNWFMKYLNLNKYDILFSDTLPEVNLSNTKSIIFANFFWNKIYNLKSKIFSKITYNLKKKKIKIYSNYLFSHKNSFKNLKVIKIGFFGKNRIKKKKLNKNILISLGTAKIGKFNQIKNEIYKLIKNNQNINFYLDKSLYKKNSKFKNIILAKHNIKMFNKVSGAIVKPGFSIINECLKYGIPIFCFNKYQNVEFKYNCNIIKKHKLGFVNNKLNILLDKLFNLSSKDRKRLLNKYKKLKWNGEKKIIDELQEK